MVLASKLGGGRWDDRTLSIDQLIKIAGRWLPMMTLLTFLPYILIWGLPNLPHWGGFWSGLLSALMWTLIGLAVYAISALVHEGLHVAAMIIVARVPLHSLSFGMRLSEGVLYVHSDQPMTATSYRVVLMLPAFVQGILPAAVGTVLGLGWLVIYGYIMIVSAIGDFAVLHLIRGHGPKAIVRDHPSDIGFQLYRPED